MRTLGRRWVTAAIVVVAAAAGGWPASAQQVAISVDLHDYAGNSQTVLRDTLRNLSDILRNAGVQVVSEGAPRYTINIVPAEIALQLKQPADGMGFAVVGEGAHLAYVLDARVSRAVGTCKTSKADVLAAVIAHELGHLLLPLNAHSPTGVMRAEWNEDDLNQTGRGALTFNLSQAKELRKSLNSQ